MNNVHEDECNKCLCLQKVYLYLHFTEATMTSASADVFLEVLIVYSSYLSLVTKSDKHSVIHLK